MAEEHLEKITDKGFIIRVNLYKGSYMIFKENAPLVNPRSKTQSIVHELPQIIFLGKEFDLKKVFPERVGFFDVYGGQIYIPFWIKGVSDVRHVKIPAYVISDMLPVYIYHFHGFHLGSIPASVGGMNYFVVDSKVDREMLIRIKMHFPLSRIIVYRGEVDAMAPEATKYDISASNENVRASDMVQADEQHVLIKNPSFAARVFLRQLEFSRMYELPIRYRMDKETIETILAYLNIMIKNSNTKPELRQNLHHIQALHRLYQFLSPFLSFDAAQVEQSFDQGIPEQETLIKIRDILQSQMDIYRVENDSKKERFFHNAIAMVEPLL